MVPLIRSLYVGFGLEFDRCGVLFVLKFFFRATWPGVLYMGMCRTVARSVDE